MNGFQNYYNPAAAYNPSFDQFSTSLSFENSAPFSTGTPSGGTNGDTTDSPKNEHMTMLNGQKIDLNHHEHETTKQERVSGGKRRNNPSVVLNVELV